MFLSFVRVLPRLLSSRFLTTAISYYRGGKCMFFIRVSFCSVLCGPRVVLVVLVVASVLIVSIVALPLIFLLLRKPPPRWPKPPQGHQSLIKGEATGGNGNGGQSWAAGTSRRQKQREATGTEVKAGQQEPAGGKSNGRQREGRPKLCNRYQQEAKATGGNGKEGHSWATTTNCMEWGYDPYIRKLPFGKTPSA